MDFCRSVSLAGAFGSLTATRSTMTAVRWYLNRTVCLSTASPVCDGPNVSGSPAVISILLKCILENCHNHRRLRCAAREYRGKQSVDSRRVRCGETNGRYLGMMHHGFEKPR